MQKISNSKQKLAKHLQQLILQKKPQKKEK